MTENKKKEYTGCSVGEIVKDFELCKTQYDREHKKMRLLNAADKGDIWKALKAKYPKYQIFTDTNYISYVKNNILSSIYTVAKGASIQPTTEEDKTIVMNLNVILEHLWDVCDVGYYQFMAGERCALVNLGITQIGWDEKLTGGNGNSFYKGNITLKNIDPMKFMMDPFATDLDNAGYCMTYDKYHKSVFEQNPLYKEKFKEFCQTQKNSPTHIPDLADERRDSASKDYYTLLIYFRKHKGKVEEYHIINENFVLYKNLDIKPAEYPFALLYCNLPGDSLIGASEPSKIFTNYVALNILDSITLTAVYKNQNPPKYVNAASGLNIGAFSKHCDEPGRAFVVNGQTDKVVYYHKYPDPPAMLSNLKVMLENDMQNTSGIDGRYTGRDTGSVITTGGVEEMLNRVTIIDTPKIMLYEKYTKTLTKLILANLIEHSPKRKYFIKKPNETTYATYEIDFPKIDADTLFQYAINISSELPKNKQRIASMANMLLEKQMQYQQEGSNVQLISEEEWLMFQDLPNKEYMLQRMGIQRHEDAIEEVSQTLFGYNELIQNGASPDDAILAMAEALKQKRSGGLEQPAIPGVVPEASMDPTMGMAAGGGMPMGGAPMGEMPMGGLTL